MGFWIRTISILILGTAFGSPCFAGDLIDNSKLVLSGSDVPSNTSFDGPADAGSSDSNVLKAVAVGASSQAGDATPTAGNPTASAYTKQKPSGQDDPSPVSDDKQLKRLIEKQAPLNNGAPPPVNQQYFFGEINVATPTWSHGQQQNDDGANDPEWASAPAPGHTNSSLRATATSPAKPVAANSDTTSAKPRDDERTTLAIELSANVASGKITEAEANQIWKSIATDSPTVGNDNASPPRQNPEVAADRSIASNGSDSAGRQPLTQRNASAQSTVPAINPTIPGSGIPVVVGSPVFGSAYTAPSEGFASAKAKADGGAAIGGRERDARSPYAGYSRSNLRPANDLSEISQGFNRQTPPTAPNRFRGLLDSMIAAKIAARAKKQAALPVDNDLPKVSGMRRMLSKVIPLEIRGLSSQGPESATDDADDDAGVPDWSWGFAIAGIALAFRAIRLARELRS